MSTPPIGPEIHIFNEDIEFDLVNKTEHIAWVFKIIESEGYSVESINYIFCSDDMILEVNKKHLNHDYFTDIITFSLREDPIVSDIFISIDRVVDNAKTHNVPFDQELLRVMAHGVLHLCGYKDKTEAESLVMRQKEDFYIALYA